MKTPGILAILFFAVATAVMGQIPRTISYQGRASDATGPVTGSRQMVLSIYTAQTGGAPIFQETQTVVFATGGVFTVGIGGATPGGIPSSILFDEPYYLGVRISGFNGDVELSPRYVLRSVPYSLRSEESNYSDGAGFADSTVAAYLADSTLRIPLVLGGHTDRTREGYIDIEDSAQGTGVALKLKGEGYALISDGVDSTSRHFVTAEENTSAGPAAAGALYRDNVPMAWGVVEPDGSLVSDFGIKSVTKLPDSSYEVVLDSPAAGVVRSGATVPDISPTITVGGLQAQPYIFAVWVYKRGPTGYDMQTIVVRCLNTDGVNTPAPFSIQVFGRPQ